MVAGLDLGRICAWGRYWGWDPKETWALVTWVIYAGYLHARATAGWRGTKAAVIAIIGMASFSVQLHRYQPAGLGPALLRRASRGGPRPEGRFAGRAVKRPEKRTPPEPHVSLAPRAAYPPMTSVASMYATAVPARRRRRGSRGIALP